MQITVPTNLDYHPLVITIGGVGYTLSAGETVNVPDAVAAELYRMIDSKVKPAPDAGLPFTDKTQEKDLQQLNTRMAAVEAAVEVKELPDFPTTDGAYSLQIVVDDGAATLTWEPVEASTPAAES